MLHPALMRDALRQVQDAALKLKRSGSDKEAVHPAPAALHSAPAACQQTSAALHPALDRCQLSHACFQFCVLTLSYFNTT